MADTVAEMAEQFELRCLANVSVLLEPVPDPGHGGDQQATHEVEVETRATANRVNRVPELDALVV